MANRTIKFRAFSFSSGMWSWEKLTGREGWESHPLTSLYSGDGWKAMQFTNLADKNGVEIYEGDIVRVFKANSYLNGVYTVEWHEIGMWAYRNPKRNFNDGWAMKGNRQPYLVGQKNCEVVGNIYQNPDLLPKS